MPCCAQQLTCLNGRTLLYIEVPGCAKPRWLDCHDAARKGVAGKVDGASSLRSEDRQDPLVVSIFCRRRRMNLRIDMKRTSYGCKVSITWSRPTARINRSPSAKGRLSTSVVEEQTVIQTGAANGVCLAQKLAETVSVV